MPRKAAIGVCFLSALALCATIAPAAQAANTWAGTWATTAGGEMVLDATGSGTYSSGRGTIRGGVNGDENRGTWNGGNGTTGTFKFTLEPDGLTFLGEGRYDDTSISANAFPWNGTCTAGACLNNGDDGGGGSCKVRSGGSGPLAMAADGLCPRDVKFSFRIRHGVPAEPDEKDLPDSLAAIEAEGFGRVTGSSDKGSGLVGLETTHLSSALQVSEHAIGLQIFGPAKYEQNRKTKHFKITFEGAVDSSSDPSCDATETFLGTFAIKDKEVALRLIFSALGGCLSTKPIVWRTKSFQKASIKKVKP